MSASPSVPFLPGLPILLVEDQPTLARSLARMLRGQAASVTVAASLSSARAALRRERPFRVVILDQGLPDGDGAELLDDLDALASRPAVIATSVNLQDSSRALRLQTSGVLLLPKPFRAEQLFAAIRHALGESNGEEADLDGGRAPSRFPPGRASGEYRSTLAFAGVALDLVAQTVTAHGAPVSLQPAQFRILAQLLAQVGRALSVEELVEGALRGTHRDGAINIRFQIHALRRRLGALGSIIETAAGGYGVGLSEAADHRRR